MKQKRGRIGKEISIGLAFLVCTFLLGGCNEKAKEPKGVEKSVSEKKKSRLQGQIDRRYEDAEAHYELGQLHQADGLWSQADNQYSTALGFDPVHRQAQAARVKVLESGGETAKSKLLAEEYIEQASVSATASLKLGLAFQDQKMDSYALKCYQRALHLAPNSAKINKQIGYYYLSRGEKDLAREYLSRSFQLNKNQPEVAGELGKLGVPVRIPPKTVKNTKKLDDMVDKSNKKSAKSK